MEFHFPVIYQLIMWVICYMILDHPAVEHHQAEGQFVDTYAPRLTGQKDSLLTRRGRVGLLALGF
jgi:hypothetical protein